MDYSKLSDKEINKLVAFAMGCKEIVPDIFMSDDRRYEFDKPKNKSGNKFYFAPCNNVADAWPIIHEHGISIAFDKNEDEWVAWGNFAFDLSGWDMKEQPGEYEHNKNPLRAAMTVFLMMQESANVQTDSPR